MPSHGLVHWDNRRHNKTNKHTHVRSFFSYSTNPSLVSVLFQASDQVRQYTLLPAGVPWEQTKNLFKGIVSNTSPATLTDSFLFIIFQDYLTWFDVSRLHWLQLYRLLKVTVLSLYLYSVSVFILNIPTHLPPRKE